MNELVLHCRAVRRDRLILEEDSLGVNILTYIGGDEQVFCIRADDIHRIIDFLEMCNANPCNRP